MILNKLYDEFIKGKFRDTPISYPMQQRILSHYLAHKDWERVGNLAHYEHLDSRIDQQIGGSDELDVLAAWSTKPGRTKEELITRLLQDGRAKAVLPLAKQIGLPEDVYDVLGGMNSYKIDVALAGNTSVPMVMRVEKMRKIVTRIPRGDKTTLDISTLCAPTGKVVYGSDSRTLYQTVAESSLWCEYVRECLRSALMRPQDIAHIIDNMEAIHACGQTTTLEAKRTDEIVYIVRLLDNYAEPISVVQREKLITFVQYLLGIEQQRLVSTRTADLAALITTLQQYDEEYEKLFDNLVTETDPEIAAKICEKLEPKCRAKLTLARYTDIVDSHKYLPAAVGLNLFDEMWHAQRVRFIGELDRRDNMDALSEVFDKDVKLLGVVFVTELLGAVTDKRKLLVALVKRKAETGRLLDEWMLTTNVVGDNLNFVIEAIDWNTLAAKAGSIPGLNALVEQTLLKALGDNQDFWDAFHVLGEDYEGSLDSLLKTACKLCA